MTAPVLPRGSLVRTLVQLAYWEVRGRLRRASPEAVRAVAEALGVDPAAPPPAVEPVTVAWDGRLRLKLRLPAPPDRLRCAVLLEGGGELEESELTVRRVGGREDSVVCHVALPGRLPWGCHRAVVSTGGRRLETMVLSAPRRLPGVAPPRLGLWVPTYGLWSRTDGFCADFEALRRAASWALARGAGVLATLPLFATLLDEPCEPSPYLPASRLFWNELFVHLLGSRGSAPTGLVDYRAAFAEKRALLEESWRQLPDRRKEEVRAWARQQPWLAQYTAFRAYLERQRRPWRAWPEAARAGVRLDGADPVAPDVYAYAQWLADRQLQAVAETGVWLYLDLPLGAHSDGFDPWQFRGLFVEGVSAGAPPDPFSALGQDWSFPPVHPQRAREDGYAYLRACLARLFRVARMVRLDHVMALHRLYWIPKGFPATEGVYVRYPADELYAAVMLEAVRAGAVVVGEDLGTVPGAVRRELKRRGLWRMYVLAFEAGSEPLRPPAADTVASLGTHDTASFASWWEGLDLVELHGLGRMTAEQMSAERGRRRAVVTALARQLGLRDPSPRTALQAALRWLAESPAGSVLVHLEDLWLETTCHNVPGTTADQHPNWRRRLRYPAEAWDELPEVSETLQDLAARRSRCP